MEVFKNNNKTFLVEFYDAEGEDYDVPSGVEIKFSVKKSVTDSDEDVLISKTITGTGESSYTIILTELDTNLPVGVYWYDFKNITDGVTLTPPTKFIIKEVVLENE